MAHKWKIFYGNGDTVGSDDYSPEDVPARDVQVIVQDYKCNISELVTSADYYGWNKGRWQGYDLFGLYDYLIEPGWKVVLFGRMLLQHEYDRIIRAANIEKSGWNPRERRTSDSLT